MPWIAAHLGSWSSRAAQDKIFSWQLLDNCTESLMILDTLAVVWFSSFSWEGITIPKWEKQGRGRNAWLNQRQKQGHTESARVEKTPGSSNPTFTKHHSTQGMSWAPPGMVAAQLPGQPVPMPNILSWGQIPPDSRWNSSLKGESWLP